MTGSVMYITANLGKVDKILSIICEMMAGRYCTGSKRQNCLP